MSLMSTKILLDVEKEAKAQGEDGNLEETQEMSFLWLSWPMKLFCFWHYDNKCGNYLQLFVGLCVYFSIMIMYGIAAFAAYDDDSNDSNDSNDSSDALYFRVATTLLVYITFLAYTLCVIYFSILIKPSIKDILLFKIEIEHINVLGLIKWFNKRGKIVFYCYCVLSTVITVWLYVKSTNDSETSTLTTLLLAIFLTFLIWPLIVICTFIAVILIQSEYNVFLLCNQFDTMFHFNNSNVFEYNDNINYSLSLDTFVCKYNDCYCKWNNLWNYKVNKIWQLLIAIIGIDIFLWFWIAVDAFNNADKVPDAQSNSVTYADVAILIAIPFMWQLYTGIRLTDIFRKLDKNVKQFIANFRFNNDNNNISVSIKQCILIESINCFQTRMQLCAIKCCVFGVDIDWIAFAATIATFVVSKIFSIVVELAQ